MGLGSDTGLKVFQHLGAFLLAVKPSSDGHWSIPFLS